MAIDPIYIHPILGELTLAEVQDNANYEEMSLEEYVSAFNLKIKEKEPVGTGTVLRPEEGKPIVVAGENVPVATEINETFALESQLEDILSEYEKVEPGGIFGDKYNGTRAGKMLLDERYSNIRSKLKKAYQGSNMDINKPMSIIDKSEEEVQEFLMDAYPGVFIEQTGVRNALNIILPGTDKPIELDLQPFTLDGRDEAVDVLKKLDQVYNSQTDEELIINTVGQLADVLDETKDDRAINKALESTGYSVSINQSSGSRKDGTYQPYSYNVLKDGVIVQEKLDVNKLRSFMKEGLGDEGYESIKKSSYEATSNYLETKAREVKAEEKIIKSNKSLDLEYFKNTYAEDIIANVNQVLPEGFSEEEQDQIREYMESNAIGEMVYNAKLDKMIKVPGKIDDDIIRMRNWRGLPENIVNKIEQAGGEDFIKKMYIAGIKEVKNQELLDRSSTIAEKIMANSGDQNLIRLGQGVAKIEKTKFDERIKAQVKELPNIQKKFIDILSAKAKEISNNSPEGTEISIEYTPSGEAIFSVSNDRNLNSEEGKKLKQAQSEMYKLQNDFANLQTDYSATIENMQREVSEFYAANPADADVFRNSMKEYGIGGLLAKDVNDAFAGILLAAPTLVNADWAVEAQRRLNAKNEYFEKMGSYDDGNFGTYFFRTLGQQSANITLAIATGGIGSAAGLSSAMTANAIGGLFGLSSGAQTYRDLKTQQQIVGTADKQAKIALNAYESGIIDLYTYTNTMRDINKTKAMSEISDAQIVNSSLANGIIEGTVTRFLGTAPNTIKLLKDFKSPTSLTSIAQNLYAGNYQKVASLIGKPLLVRGAGELAEEELIYGGQQFITEYGILDRELDLSAWDDTAMSTIITLGVSQSPGVAYSGMVNYNATKKFEQKINKLRINNNELSTLIQDSKLDDKQKKLLLSDMASNLQEQGLELDRLGVDILGRDVNDIKRLIGTELIKSQLLSQAGVMPGMSDVDKAEVINSYKESLSKEQAKVFETQLNVLDSQTKDIKEKPTSTKKAKESLGDLWTNNNKYLRKVNKDNYKSKSTEDQIVAVINHVRESVSRESKRAAKANPEIVEIVENETINDKPLNNKQKESRYKELGDQMALDRSRAISVAEGVSAKASDIFADIKSVKFVEYTTEEELREALENQGVDVNSEEYKNAVSKFNNGETYGAVMGNTIITQDRDQAAKDLDKGQIKAGTVILHEFSHIVDDARIKPENRKLYAENLAAAAAKTNNKAIEAVDKSVRNMLDNLYADENLTFENSEKYRDEYTKYMQEYLYAYEDEVQIEQEDSFMTRVFNNTNPNKLNTPEKALSYLAANNAAFRAGKVSKKTKKALQEFEGKDTKFSDKSTVNKLAVEYKNDPNSFNTGDKYFDFFTQYQSVALDAMGYNVAKGDILADEASQFVATEFESVIKNYKPVDKDGNKQAFTTYVFNVFKAGRANKFYKQEFAPKDFKQTRIGVGFDIAAQDSNETLEEREAREAKETVSKIDPRKFKIVSPDIKKLENLVNISQSDIAPFNADFKSISSKFGTKIASSIYNISEGKLDKNANLTYAKKIINGIPESSEAGRIQDDFRNDQEVRKFIKLLPPTNVTSKESEVGTKGEKILVSKDVQGRSIGLKGRVLNYFYADKTGERSSGLSSQPFIRRLKPEFTGNISTQTIKDLQEAMGITPAGELNRYDRNIGTFLSGIAKLKGSIVANTIARDKASKLNQKSSRSPKQIQADIGAGRSDIQFSEKVKGILANPVFKLETRGVDGLLKAYGIDGTFKFKTREDVDKYVAEVKKNLLPLMPRAFWFGKGGGTVFTPTSKVLGKNEKSLYYDYYVDQMKALGNLDLNPNQKYGAPIKGVSDFSVSGYDTLFKTKEIIKAKVKSGDIAAFNRKVGKIHQAMWYRFNKAIQSNKENAKVIGNYLKITGSDTGHWHKLGAQFVGYSNKITGSRFEYEHAMPATSAYLYLLDVSLSKSAFESAYDFVIDNYKLISLDKAMDKKLIAVGLRSEMPIGWNLLNNKWYDRYFSELVATVDGGIDPRGLISIDGTNFQDKYNINADGSPYIRGTFKPEAKSQVKKDNIADKAMKNARSPKYSEKIKKARVFDFDDTLAQTKSNVLYTMPDGTKGKIDAGTFAKDAGRMEAEGAVWDFSEFSKVMNGKKGPLFDVAKKIQDVRGSEDIFVLTARPQDAAGPIKEFLGSLGLNIPLKNITGLADGRPQAKADWMLGKFAEGYNDFYFTDDHLGNVKAVKDVLSVLDVKSKVQQARIKFSEKLSDEFNSMIERNKGVDAKATFSDALARRRGQKQKRFSFFIPPSADDFRGLTMYTFAGKGKQGEADQEFFDKALIKPYMRGVGAVEQAKQRITNDYRALIKKYPKIKKKLRKKFEGTKYTTDEAVRIFLWDRAGFTIPGLSKTDQAKIVNLVSKNESMVQFADGVELVTRLDTFVEPNEFWDASTIIGDLSRVGRDVNRKEYLSEFIENVDIIFSPKNLNKVQAVYGFRVREALEDSIRRMKSGNNKTSGGGRLVESWNNWVNNSVGAIMFFNRRSALLQLMSSANFINWSDNNPAQAALALANQPQYWKDVIRLFNSDKLKQRRSGLEGDIQEAEIAQASRKGGMTGVISYLLKIGFTPTQIADSIAISTGGATFYRNRINTYKKQGFEADEAEAKAFEDFSAISDETQQSADPMLISGQQSSVLGRLVLAFQNTPMQYTRLIKKAGQDLINGRGSKKQNISKILYYGAIQNFIFNALQNALFALVPGFDDEDEDFATDKEKEKYDEKKIRSEENKIARIANGMVDSIVRGSGLAGAVAVTIKNTIREFIEFQEKPQFSRENADIILAALQISPPIGSKARKINAALQTLQYEKDVINERGFDVMIDGKFQLSPTYNMIGSLSAATLNLPLDRAVDEINSITEALDTRNTQWQRIALGLGWRSWDTGVKIEEHDLIKTKAKAARKEAGKIKAKETRKINKQKTKEYKAYRLLVLESVPDSVLEMIYSEERKTGKPYPAFKLQKIYDKYSDLK